MIDPDHPELSVVRQCELVSISRSGFYYQPACSALMPLVRSTNDQTPEALVGFRGGGSGWGSAEARSLI